MAGRSLELKFWEVDWMVRDAINQAASQNEGTERKWWVCFVS